MEKLNASDQIPVFVRITEATDKKIVVINQLVDELEMKLQSLSKTNNDMPDFSKSETENSLHGCMERFINNLDIVKIKLEIINNKLNELL